MADVTKGIRGYVADTREYAANTRIDIHAPNSVCRVYASSRGNIKGYQSSHKYSQIRGLDIRRYADIRGHSHRFTVTYPRMALLVTSALHGSAPANQPACGETLRGQRLALFQVSYSLLGLKMRSII